MAFFFLNPAFACGPAEPEYHFGAPEMSFAVEGNWTFAISPQGGGPLQNVTVHVEQASSAQGTATAALSPRRPLIRAAHACGGRTLVKSAAACVDITRMPLVVTVVSGDAAFAASAPVGDFNVYGYEFRQGTLGLKVGPYQLQIQVFADRTFGDAHAMMSSGEHASVTLVTRS